MKVEMLSSEEVAAYYGVHLKTLNTAIEAGRAPPADRVGGGRRRYWFPETVKQTPFTPPNAASWRQKRGIVLQADLRRAPVPQYPRKAKANRRMVHFFGGLKGEVR